MSLPPKKSKSKLSNSSDENPEPQKSAEDKPPKVKASKAKETAVDSSDDSNKNEAESSKESKKKKKAADPEEVKEPELSKKSVVPELSKKSVVLVTSENVSPRPGSQIIDHTPLNRETVGVKSKQNFFTKLFKSTQVINTRLSVATVASESGNATSELNTITIKIITWNVAAKRPVGDISKLSLLPNKQCKTIPDILVVGFTDVGCQPGSISYGNVVVDSSQHEDWRDFVSSYLTPLKYVIVKKQVQLGIQLILYCQFKHLAFIKELQLEGKRVSIRDIWESKGAIILSFKFYDHRICLVNSLLHPQESLFDTRISDYEHIKRSDLLNGSPDFVFWFGSLNFPLFTSHLAHDIILKLIEKKDYEHLLNEDQLTVCFTKKLAFEEFQEKQPNFPPNYKFRTGKKDKYEINARPAWTERILYKVGSKDGENLSEMIEIVEYTSHNIRITSHKPISAVFKIKTYCENLVQDVKFENFDPWETDSAMLVRYTVQNGYVPKDGDSIIVLKCDCQSLTNYLCEEVAPTQATDETFHQVVFPPDTIKEAGEYVIVYQNIYTDEVYGVSEPFVAKPYGGICC